MEKLVSGALYVVLVLLFVCCLADTVKQLFQ